MNSGTQVYSARTWCLAIALLTVLGLVQGLPLLDQIDFHHEEGRRVMPAREMLASDNWISPTLLGRPYLSKPPGIYWLLGGLFRLTGESTVFVARLLSVLATLGTLISTLVIGARLVSMRAGLLSAILFLGFTETLAKSRLAEIEASLALAVVVAIGAWWFGLRGHQGWSWLAGLALGASLLLKGPAALLFFGGPWLLVAWLPGVERPWSKLRHWLPLGLGLLLPGLWLLAYFQQIDTETATAHWSSQIGGQGGHTLGQFLKERRSYFFGSLLACLPASSILLTSWISQTFEWKRPTSALAFATVATSIGWLFFMIFPGTSVRYFYPLMPFVALLAGARLHGIWSTGSPSTIARRVDLLARVFLILAALIGLATLVGSQIQIADVNVNAWGMLLGTAFVATAVFGWSGPPQRRQLLAFLVIPLLFGQLSLSQLEPGKAERHQRAPYAAQIDAELEPSQVLKVCTWSNFNTLLYVQHELSYVPDWRKLDPGDVALLGPVQVDTIEADQDWAPRIQKLRELRIRNSRLTVVRVRP